MSEPKVPVTKEELVTDVTDKYNKMEQYYRPKHLRMFKNMAFLIGKQWVTTDVSNSYLTDVAMIRRKDKKIRFVANKILPVIRVQLSKLLKIQPKISVEASTDEWDDIAGAKVADKVAWWLWHYLMMRKSLQSLGLWMLTCGTTYAMPYWNPQLGSTVADPATGESISIGDIDNNLFSAFDVLPDYMSQEDLNDCRFVITSQVMTPESVWDMWGVEVKGKNVALSNMESRIRTLFDSAQPEIENGVTVRTCWYRPDRNFPKGRVAILGNEELIQDLPEIPEEYYDPHDWCPIVKFDASSFPVGSLIKQSTIEVLEPVQKQTNVLHGLIMSHLRVKGKILRPSGVKMDEDAFTADGEEIIDFTPVGGVGPTHLAAPALNSDVWNHLKVMDQLFMDLPGVHEVSQANVPGGVKSGIAIDYLQEQDDTQMGPTVALFGVALERWCKKALRIVQKKYTEERSIRITGRGNKEEVLKFKGEDLTDSCDLTINMDSALPRSKAARVQTYFNLYDRKAIDARTLNKLIGMAETEDLWEQDMLDEANARSENDSMSSETSQVPVPQPFDNHAVHLNIHNQVRKKPGFKDLPQEFKNAFNAHCAIHEEAIQAAQAAQAQAQAGPPKVGG